ncbi:unnamed protein product [Heligmosomoides polygyrus]|uniref:guanylate cyclase n=1 Tax=Heligmosomoides polygyrus TaxID=6339 RepID=A0A3P8ARR9_HELPZ|nr:unnamed protein product [Heligmosomoides polygyrus]
MLKNREKNRVRRVDEDWMRQSQVRKQLGDIYAFGIIMYEIIFRALPFPDSSDISALIGSFTLTSDIAAIVESIKDGSKVVKPQIQSNKVLNMDLSNLISDCWNSSPEMRPSLRRIKLNVETYLKVRGSLVDQMMRMMEQYANNLEKIVQERTGMLEEANVRADKLLSQLLPAYVAKELKHGRSVPPKMYSSATILFSDIVGFDELCKSATPLEVVNVLNGVETIGDAYMVVSGIPEENGHRHINEIACIALDVHKYLTEFVVPHKPNERIVDAYNIFQNCEDYFFVEIDEFHISYRSCRGGRCGIERSSILPIWRHRLVNMSSRMESNSEPGRTQISDAAKNLLMQHYPDHQTEERGEIPIKVS